MIRWPIIFLMTFCLSGSVFASEEPFFPHLVFVKDVKPIEFIRPPYPRDALRRDLAGSVRVAIAVSKDGVITDKRTILSEPFGVFEQVVLDTLEKWQYKPYLIDGVPTAFQTIFSFKFDLGDSRPPQKLKLIFRTERMRAEIKSGRLSQDTNDFKLIQLTQKLDKNERGWTFINIAIPNQWNIKDFTIKDGYVQFMNSDGETYKLTSENTEKIQDSITKFYPVKNDQLLEIWHEFAFIKRQDRNPQ